MRQIHGHRDPFGKLRAGSSRTERAKNGRALLWLCHGRRGHPFRVTANLCGRRGWPLLEKREKWRTPRSFVSAIEGKARVMLSALMWPTPFHDDPFHTMIPAFVAMPGIC